VFRVLNRGNGRRALFFGSADYEAFVRVVKEALLIVPMRILGYCLTPCGPWVEHTARHLGLEATPRSRGRPPKKRSSQGNAPLRDNNMAHRKGILPALPKQTAVDGWGRAAGVRSPFRSACHGSPPPAARPRHHAEHFPHPQLCRASMPHAERSCTPLGAICRRSVWKTPTETGGRSTRPPVHPSTRPPVAQLVATPASLVHKTSMWAAVDNERDAFRNLSLEKATVLQETTVAFQASDTYTRWPPSIRPEERGGVRSW
jgi:hypothetical protein